MAILAVYRLAHMLTIERGPFDLAHKFRSAVYRRWPDRSGVESWQFAGAVCPLCVSFWLGCLAALVLPFANLREYVVTALGVSGAVVIIHKATSK